MDSPLDDGTYDALIVWAERDDDALVLDVAITTGPHKGDVVEVRARGLRVRDELILAATPCMLVVEAGAPRVELGSRASDARRPGSG